jgi:hypothetical protein
MGFFKDMKKLNDMGKEAQKDFDPAAQMQQGMAAMQQAQQMMAQQTEAAQLAATGTTATLQVTASRDLGTQVNMQPMIELQLLVMPEGGAPYPTTVQQVVPMTALARIAPGSSLTGKVDPANQSLVWINWNA